MQVEQLGVEKALDEACDVRRGFRIDYHIDTFVPQVDDVFVVVADYVGLGCQPVVGRAHQLYAVVLIAVLAGFFFFQLFDQFQLYGIASGDVDIGQLVVDIIQLCQVIRQLPKVLLLSTCNKKANLENELKLPSLSSRPFLSEPFGIVFE
jgi:hypothetical protein